MLGTKYVGRILIFWRKSLGEETLGVTIDHTILIIGTTWYRPMIIHVFFGS